MSDTSMVEHRVEPVFLLQEWSAFTFLSSDVLRFCSARIGARQPDSRRYHPLVMPTWINGAAASRYPAQRLICVGGIGRRSSFLFQRSRWTSSRLAPKVA